MKNNILINTTLVLLTTTILFGVGLSSNSASATTASTALASVKVAASCTLTTSGGGNYSATIPNGTSAEIAGSTMSVSCNDAGGFALYAVGYSDDAIGNNNMIGSSTNIPTNTSGTNSYWAMKINPTSGTTPTIENSFNNYHIVPDIHTKIASYASSTGTGSLSVNATYKANISSTQLAGNYLGKVKYTLIHPAAGPAPVAPLAASDCPARSICYAPNADDIEGTMLGTEFEAVAASPKAGRQTNVSVNSTANLRAYNYSRPGYGFAGWSPSYEASTTSTSTDTIYGPMETISTNPSDPKGADVSTNGLILYPVWVASTGSMQTFSSSDCNAMSIGDVTARMDIRDNETYAIAKLVDGKCWMVENLRLSDDANITPSNTQSNNGAFGGVFTGLAKSENANFANTTPPVPNSLYSTDGTTINVISGGNNSYWSYRMPRYNDNNTNRSLTASYLGEGISTYYQWYGYGNYYTWPAAIADTNHYSNGDHNTTSICPAGWGIPTSGTTGIFYILGIAVNSDATDLTASKNFRSYPNNFLYSGYFSGRGPGDRGKYGSYWSSTVCSYDNAYKLFLNYNSVHTTGDNDIKYKGVPIRCLFGS
jgi:uncharacterized protein (TIGR02145 family)